MHPELRAKFNAEFSSEKYERLKECVNTRERWPADFRLGETPVFLTREFCDEAVAAASEILRLLRTRQFSAHAATAIPDGLSVPGEPPHPHFLAIDFGICQVADRLSPRLIELQAFPSLYGFQLLLLDCLRKTYRVIPRNWTSSFGGMTDEAYLDLLRRVVLADHAKEEVVLLEIEPSKQNTRVDFAATESLLGVRPLCVTEVRKRGAQLFYVRDGKEVRIRRIYNRVIFDELLRRSDLQLSFSFQDELEVEWAGHPNWFFRISKHSLPFLKTPHTAPAWFADDFPAGESLSHYVLKPLYSFSGLGVDLEPSDEKLRNLPKPREWIVQKKVDYAAFIPTPDGSRSKAELRMMFIWPDGDQPIPVNNLVRLSQGAMMGVKYNKNKTWVGASIALHER